MTLSEIEVIADRKAKKEREEWERVRYGWFFMGRAMGADLKQPSDVMKFPWEIAKKPKKVSKKRLQQRAKSLQKTWQRGRIIQ